MKASVRVALIALLVLTYMAQAKQYIPPDCRVYYSPYAFGPGKSGLVSGHVRYSPYAFRPGHNGLVPDTARYSPYAFGPGKTGLIIDNGCYYPCHGYGHMDDVRGMQHATRRLEYAVDSLNKTLESQRSSGCRQSAPTYGYSNARNITTGGCDPKRIAREYLKQRCPQSYRLTRIICIDGETVSFDIVLSDPNVIVKYWNPVKIEQVKKNRTFKAKALNKYMCNWFNAQKRYTQKGKHILHIATNDHRDMLDALSVVLACVDS